MPTRLARMLRVVEDEHLRAGRLRSDKTRILRHVTRTIHLTVVIDAYLRLDLTSDITKTTKLCKTVAVNTYGNEIIAPPRSIS